ncbi:MULTISPECIES: hypothetical protein [unclassified Picosynechococcus]|uniref:hypothetical protein n=1 Tax=unclassified Picosynechococcus TaxID=3079910 RepID=UPI0004AAB3DA|nr:MULTISPECIES: hypothetical protein [unclassified Picosynechococcus]ANV91734.1 hypothetical protein AWQ24_14505 [Picosynechococcus sp. PCC 8807]
MSVTLKKISTLSIASMLMASQGLVWNFAASAEVLNRYHGRCKLSINNSTSYDGYCTTRHMQNSQYDQSVVIQLDNGTQYDFRGSSLDYLEVQDWDGIHSVTHQYDRDREIFIWNTAGSQNSLSVKMDTQHESQTSHDDDSGNGGTVGAIIGAGLGLLIGSLFSGGSDNKSPSTSLPDNPYANNMDYYNATAYFKCSVGDADKDQQCPGGIKRYGGGRASITVLFPNRNEVTYDFNGSNVTSSFSNDLTWGKSNDVWSIGIDRNLFIDIPEAAVYGG